MTKKQEHFNRESNLTNDENRLLDLIEQFGNKTDGVSIFFLFKRLKINGIKDLPKFMKCTIKDFERFDNVGSEKAKLFVKMQEYWNNN